MNRILYSFQGWFQVIPGQEGEIRILIEVLETNVVALFFGVGIEPGRA